MGCQGDGFIGVLSGHGAACPYGLRFRDRVVVVVLVQPHAAAAELRAVLVNVWLVLDVL